MNLIHRPMLLTDIKAAMAISFDSFLYSDPHSQREVEKLWRDIVIRESGIAAVIEDRDSPPGEQMLYAALGVFLTDKVAALIIKGERPYVSRHIYEMWRDGAEPFLSQAQIAEANSTTGLNLLAMHTGLIPAALHPVEGRGLRDRIESYSYYGMGGYNYKEVIFATYGDFVYQWLCNSGMSLKCDYASHFHSAGKQPPSAEYPRLMGYAREEAAVQDGKNVRQTILTAQPRFYFSPPERKMLLFALQSLTDDEIAEMLHVSVPTIRKRWQSVYDRVHEIEPARLGTPQQSGGTGQKKRKLLDYLRHHMEEMRPYSPPAAGH